MSDFTALNFIFEFINCESPYSCPLLKSDLHFKSVKGTFLTLPKPISRRLPFF